MFGKNASCRTRKLAKMLILFSSLLKTRQKRLKIWRRSFCYCQLKYEWRVLHYKIWIQRKLDRKRKEKRKNRHRFIRLIRASIVTSAPCIGWAWNPPKSYVSSLQLPRRESRSDVAEISLEVSNGLGGNRDSTDLCLERPRRESRSEINSNGGCPHLFRSLGIHVLDL